jgi:hypothetical protein
MARPGRVELSAAEKIGEYCSSELQAEGHFDDGARQPNIFSGVTS